MKANWIRLVKIRWEGINKLGKGLKYIRNKCHIKAEIYKKKAEIYKKKVDTLNLLGYNV